MSRNVVETILGAVVLVVAVGFGAWAYGRSNLGDSSGYELRAQFDRADGLDVGADVRISGIKIGRVLAQSLDQETYRAEVTFSVRNGIELPADSSAAIMSASLLGGKFLAHRPGRRRQDAEERRGDHADPVGGEPRGPDRQVHLRQRQRRRWRLRRGCS